MKYIIAYRDGVPSNNILDEVSFKEFMERAEMERLTHVIVAVWKIKEKNEH